MEQKMYTGMFGRRVSTATCLGFVILQFLLYAEAGEIRIAPQTQHLLLNVDRIATFFCQAVGIDAFWSINDMSVLATGTSTLREMGWRFNETLILDTDIERNNIHNLTLQIPSRIEFNNTKISCVGSVHDPAVSDPVYLIIKEIVLSAAPGKIFAPSLFYTVKNESISFSCDALGINAFWRINSSTINDEGETIWTEKGFTFHKNVTYDPMGNEHLHHNTLQMVSCVEQNNTVIICIALDTSHEPLRSDTITIIIMGAPSSPIPITIFDRPGVVTLEWDIPFSWSTYPVQSYNIVASNRSYLSRDDVNETRVQFVADEEQQECEMIEFKVRAVSDLGAGEYGSVIAGFPIEPQLMDNSIDSIQISSQGSGQSQLSIKIKLPRVCSYQSTSYTIRIISTDMSESTHSPVTRGPFNGTVTSDNVTLTEYLEEGKTYQINVEFISDVLPEPLMVFKDIFMEQAPHLPPVCEELSLPASGIIEYSSNQSVGSTASYLNFQCTLGFEQGGDLVRRCSESGWDGQHPHCRLTTLTITAISVVATLVLTVTISAVVFMFIFRRYHIRRRLRRHVYDVPDHYPLPPLPPRIHRLDSGINDTISNKDVEYDETFFTAATGINDIPWNTHGQSNIENGDDPSTGAENFQNTVVENDLMQNFNESVKVQENENIARAANINFERIPVINESIFDAEALGLQEHQEIADESVIQPNTLEKESTTCDSEETAHVQMQENTSYQPSTNFVYFNNPAYVTNNIAIAPEILTEDNSAYQHTCSSQQRSNSDNNIMNISSCSDSANTMM